MGDNNTILEFECLGIENGGIFPPEHTGRGEDSSPEFIIHNLSEQCNTLAITLEDLSHPIKGFTHWLIWNILYNNIRIRNRFRFDLKCNWRLYAGGI